MPKTSKADDDEPPKVCGKKLKRQRRKEEMKKYREEQEEADKMDLVLNRKEVGSSYSILVFLVFDL